MNIDIKRLENIKDQLDQLDDNEVLFIDDNLNTKYVIMPIDMYDKAEELLNMFDDARANEIKVKVVSPNTGNELTYEEYEKIKTTIMEAVEKTFKPKAEKLN